MVYFVNNVESQSGVLPLSHLTLFALREVSSWNFFAVCVFFADWRRMEKLVRSGWSIFAKVFSGSEGGERASRSA